MKKKGQTGQTLMLIIAAVAVLAVAVPLVSAYEAHTVNVTARVEERFNVFKAMRPATDGEIQYAIAQGFFSEDQNPIPGPPGFPGQDPPPEVLVNTLVVWVVTIYVYNPHSENMTEVVVTDRFGAELAGEPLPSDNTTAPVDLTVIYHSRGKSKKQGFETQYRITWYVTYVSGLEDPDDPNTPVDNSGVMAPGDSEMVEILVWTKLNPAGRQEYTSPGRYTLNSGPTAKWLDPEGHQHSFEGESLEVIAVEY